MSGARTTPLDLDPMNNWPQEIITDITLFIQVINFSVECLHYLIIHHKSTQLIILRPYSTLS